MKKVLILVFAVIASASLFAADFDGITALGVNYEYREDIHMGGLSVQNFGYFGACPVGYLANINADFNLEDNKSTIGMLIAPSYRYKLEDVNMSIDAAVGVSATGEWFGGAGDFLLGIGGYLGATYYLDSFALLIGCTLGYDMMSVGLDSGNIEYAGDFYVSPSISFGFRY